MTNTRLNPERVTEARLELSMSQTSLATYSGISRVTISRIESGLVPSPGIETMSTLSWALRKPVSYFFPTGKLNYKITTVPSFRSLKSKSKADEMLTSLKIYDCALLVQFLYEKIKPRFVALDIAEPVPFSHNDYDMDVAEAAAVNVRRQLDIGDSPVSNVCIYLENNGILCFPANLPSKIGSVNVSLQTGDGKETSIVLFSNKLNYYRLRFTLAHELGHIVLHHFLAEDEYGQDYETIERQAHRFASAFLMPKKPFIASIGPLTLTGILKLKDKWNVSAAAIVKRLYDLRLIDERRYEFFQVEMSRKKWKRSEPGDDKFEPEDPYYMREAYGFVFQKKLASPELLMDYTGLSPETLVAYIGNENYLMPARAKNEFQSWI